MVEEACPVAKAAAATAHLGKAMMDEEEPRAAWRTTGKGKPAVASSATSSASAPRGRGLSPTAEQGVQKARGVGAIGNAAARKATDEAVAALAGALEEDEEPSLAKGKGKKGKAAAKNNNENKDSKGLAAALHSLLPTITRLLLFNSQMVRDIASVAFTTFVIPTECLIVTCMKKETKNYADEVWGNPSHELGSPHVHAYLGFLEGLLKQLLPFTGTRFSQDALTEVKPTNQQRTKSPWRT